jgi:glycosyltransferase involved in cell wall biosynthesis
LRAFGNGFAGSATPVPVEGDADVGLIFFEEDVLPAEALAHVRAYRLIIAGSSWNARVLRAHGLTNVAYVIQGVDTSVFHPGPRTGLLADRFVILSGGKLEHRKGQDIVVAAFREFHRRHPEALLVHAWHNAWPQTAMEIARRGLVDGPPPLRDGRLDIATWLATNGIPADAHLEVPPLPNAQLGPVYRDADVAVFPNRCEGGTNLVAMECIASGVPVIVSDATGQADLAAIPGVHALAAPPLPDEAERATGRRDWGEVRVADVVEALEAVHADRRAARDRARQAARWMAARDWGTQMAVVLDAVEAAAVNPPAAGADTDRRQPALRAAGDA